MEVENELKFLLKEGYKRSEGISDSAKKFIPHAMRMDRHLLVYYDYKDHLLKRGNTFRMSFRKVDGVNKNRVTYKQQMDNDSFVRVANEYHIEANKDINGFMRSISIDKLPTEFARLINLAQLNRQCWLLVQRFRLNYYGLRVDLDICKTNRGMYFEELEIEDPDMNNNIINYFIKAYPKSLLNKYERTRILNEEDICKQINKT